MPSLTPNTAPLVIVSWRDIVEFAQWNDDEEEQVATVDSVGWLLEERPQWLRIARDYNWEDEKWSGVVMIPKLPPEIRVVKEAE